MRQKERAMNTFEEREPEKLVACEICMKEVPLSEASVPEASDYFVHFCGLECFAKWKQQFAADKDAPTATE